MYTLVLAMTSLLLAAADDPGYQLARYGNTLMVTAPTGQSGMPSGVLAQRMTVDFVTADIDEVAGMLRRTTALTVVVMPDLRARGVAITLAAHDMQLGHLLSWLATVGDFHQGFIDGALCLSAAPIQGPSVTRFYDVSDLVLTVPHFPGPELSIPVNGGGSVIMPAEDELPTTTVDDLVALIERSVHPPR